LGFSSGFLMVSGSQRHLFLTSIAVGVGCLLLLDFYFAPEAIAVLPEDGGAVDGQIISRTAQPPTSSTASGQSSSSGAPQKDGAAPAVRVVIDPAARVPTIIARFESEVTEPSDQSAIRALATAMIEDHDARIVLEGHSDTHGGDDYNHEISLKRAEWVKSRLVELGVSPDRIETSGLGATHPLRSDLPDAESVNRRVEVRWIKVGNK
jgi:outer membrane protein OmpA-like peptidoglycan-associated protein